MLRNIPIGLYYPGKSLLHCLQARTKLLFLVFMVVCLYLANRHTWHFVPIIAALVVLCLAVLCSGISPGEIWKRTWLLVLLTVVGLFTTLNAVDRTSKPLYSLGPLVVSYGLVRTILLFAGSISTLLCISWFLPLASLHALWQKRWLRRMRGLLILIALGSWFFLWLYSDTPASRALNIGPYIITRSGVWSAVALSTMLLVLYVSSLLLTMTTSPVALIEGMNMLLAPLRFFRLPVDSFSLMTLLALRFIPTLMDEIEQLLKAQTARGADMSSGTIRERMESLIVLVVSLIRGVLRTADELATALEARGYEVEGKQTRLYETTLHWFDYLTLAVVAVIMISALLV